MYCESNLFESVLFKYEVVVFYTDTSIELRTSLLPFLTSVASTNSLVTLSRILVSNFCPGFQFGLAAFTAAYIADLYCPFVRHLCHSHHGYLIDPRHIGCTIHLWTAFVSLTCYGISLPALPGFTQSLASACRSIRGGVSGRYSFIPPLELSVHRTD